MCSHIQKIGKARMDANCTPHYMDHDDVNVHNTHTNIGALMIKIIHSIDDDFQIKKFFLLLFHIVFDEFVCRKCTFQKMFPSINKRVTGFLFYFMFSMKKQLEIFAAICIICMQISFFRAKDEKFCSEIKQRRKSA